MLPHITKISHNVTLAESKELLFCMTVCITTAWNSFNTNLLIAPSLGVI